MQATVKGRSTHFNLGPGQYEDLKVRAWTDAKRPGEGKVVVAVEGTVMVYCGTGGEHTVAIDERDVSWLNLDSDIAMMRRGDEDAAEQVVARMVAWALEDWSDPCDDGAEGMVL